MLRGRGSERRPRLGIALEVRICGSPRMAGRCACRRAHILLTEGRQAEWLSRGCASRAGAAALPASPLVLLLADPDAERFMARRLAPMPQRARVALSGRSEVERRRTLQVRIHGLSACCASALNDAVANPSGDRLPRLQVRVDVERLRRFAGGPALDDLDPAGRHEVSEDAIP